MTKLTRPQLDELVDHLMTKNMKLESALRHLAVSAQEVSNVADYPQPGAFGDDHRLDVWKRQLDADLTQAFTALDRYDYGNPAQEQP